MSDLNNLDQEAADEVQESAADTGVKVYGEFTVDHETQILTRKAVAMQSAVSNRWIVAEPRVSRIFGAVKDDEGNVLNMGPYESGTEAHKALLEFLRECHPMAGKHAQQVLSYKSAKAGGADPETLDDLERRRNFTGDKIKNDLKNAMRALKDAFVKNKAGEKGERTTKSPADLVKELALKMGKIADKQGIADADKQFASRMKQVLDGCVASQESFTSIWNAIPLAPVAARITKDYTIPGAATDITAEYLAEQLAEAALG